MVLSGQLVWQMGVTYSYRAGIMEGDTTIPHSETIHRWTACCLHPCKLEVADKIRTDGQ